MVPIGNLRVKRFASSEVVKLTENNYRKEISAEATNDFQGDGDYLPGYLLAEILTCTFSYKMASQSENIEQPPSQPTVYSEDCNNNNDKYPGELTDLFNIVQFMNLTNSSIHIPTTNDNFPEIVLHFSKEVSVILFVLLPFVSISTAIGNLLVMAAVLTYRPLKSPQNYLLVSLAAWDFSVGLFLMPLSTIDYLIQPWILGSIICNIYVTSDVFFCTASILNLCAIALDRLVLFLYLKFKTLFFEESFEKIIF